MADVWDDAEFVRSIGGGPAFPTQNRKPQSRDDGNYVGVAWGSAGNYVEMRRLSSQGQLGTNRRRPTGFFIKFLLLCEDLGRPQI